MLQLLVYLILPNYILGFNNILRPIEETVYKKGYDQRDITEIDNIGLIKEYFVKKDLLDKLESNKISNLEKLLWIKQPVYNDFLPFLNTGLGPNILAGGLLDDFDFEIN